MHEYRYCGHVVQSAIDLPELQPADVARDGAPAWTCGPGPIDGETSSRPIHRWVTDEGDAWLDIASNGAVYRLQFASGYVFDVNGATVTWNEDGTASSDTLRHLLLDQVLPLAMSAKGEYVLHAAAVRVDGRAILLAGTSGRGKSTLAARCVARGADLLADDCVRITRHAGRWMAHASYPGLRLWPDAASCVRPGVAASPVAHYTEKLRVDAPTPVPWAALDTIYLLDRAPVPAPAIRSGGAALAPALTRFVFRIDPGRREHIARDFDVTAMLVESGVVKRLVMPDTLEGLDAVAALVESGEAPA